jgi:hypothetical protein
MQTFQFKIQLQNIQDPPVWRRVLVPADITFDEFHQIIQAAFGWENYHMYSFSKSGWSSPVFYKIPDDEDDEKVEDSSETSISEVFTKAKQTFTYIYDFGDDWKHRILLEGILDEQLIAPICTAGKGACPPEDCGGVTGYYNLIDILSNPKDPEHKEMKSWLGLGKNGQWDANAFDINIANERINSIGDDDE